MRFLIPQRDELPDLGQVAGRDAFREDLWEALRERGDVTVHGVDEIVRTTLVLEALHDWEGFDRERTLFLEVPPDASPGVVMRALWLGTTGTLENQVPWELLLHDTFGGRPECHVFFRVPLDLIDRLDLTVVISGLRLERESPFFERYYWRRGKEKPRGRILFLGEAPEGLESLDERFGSWLLTTPERKERRDSNPSFFASFTKESPPILELLAATYDPLSEEVLEQVGNSKFLWFREKSWRSFVEPPLVREQEGRWMIGPGFRERFRREEDPGEKPSELPAWLHLQESAELALVRIEYWIRRADAVSAERELEIHFDALAREGYLFRLNQVLSWSLDARLLRWKIRGLAEAGWTVRAQELIKEIPSPEEGIDLFTIREIVRAQSTNTSSRYFLAFDPLFRDGDLFKEIPTGLDEHRHSALSEIYIAYLQSLLEQKGGAEKAAELLGLVTPKEEGLRFRLACTEARVLCDSGEEARAAQIHYSWAQKLRGESWREFPKLIDLAEHLLRYGEVQKVYELVEQNVAELRDSDFFISHGGRLSLVYGAALFYDGRFSESREVFERLCEPGVHEEIAARSREWLKALDVEEGNCGGISTRAIHEHKPWMETYLLPPKTLIGWFSAARLEILRGEDPFERRLSSYGDLDTVVFEHWLRKGERGQSSTGREKYERILQQLRLKAREEAAEALTYEKKISAYSGLLLDAALEGNHVDARNCFQAFLESAQERGNRLAELRARQAYCEALVLLGSDEVEEEVEAFQSLGEEYQIPRYEALGRFWSLFLPHRQGPSAVRETLASLADQEDLAPMAARRSALYLGKEVSGDRVDRMLNDRLKAILEEE